MLNDDGTMKTPLATIEDVQQAPPAVSSSEAMQRSLDRMHAINHSQGAVYSGARWTGSGRHVTPDGKFRNA